MLFLATAFPNVYADTRSDYERYISAYNTYRNAVIENKPVQEIKNLLDNYLDAKKAYESNLAKPKDEVLDGTSTATAETADIESFVDGAPAEAVSGATSTVKLQLPEGLKRILTNLWSEKGRKSPDAMIKLLETFIDNNPNSKFAALASYELAKAYDLLKNDQETSAKILVEITKRHPDTKLGNIAKQRLAYYAATKNHLKWKQVLNQSYKESQDSYAKYLNTSWLAFPVKATRWIGYAKKLGTFEKNQENFEKFQIWYENMGAQFAPPVEITFDRFKPATGMPTQDAEVSLRYTNSEAWYSRWKLIHDARQSIDVQYFIINDDAFGMSLLGALLKKAKEGVKVRLMMDARGTKNLSRTFLGQDFLQELSELPNCEVKVFNPVHQNLLTALTDIRRLIASDHDKILVIDGQYAIVGGRNISKDYFLDPEDHPSAYRDCDVIINSREVAEQLDYAFDEEFSALKQYRIKKEFLGNWDSRLANLYAANDAMYSHILNETLRILPTADKKYIKGAKKYMKELSAYSHLRSYAGFDPFSNSVQAPVKIVDKHSFDGPRNDITDVIVKYIDGSRKEILIQNPYVVLTERLFAALQRAGKRNVTVKIHTNSPYSTDSLATQAMFYADWKRILSRIPNSHIYVFHGTRKLHAKNWAFDGKISVVGTYNLDYISEDVNSEVVATIKSQEFTSQLRSGILSDIANSKEYQISIDERGNVESVFGPDDVKGKNFWLLKTLSKLTFLKKII
ncbi:MAG: hypothetical protein Kow0029_05100 [Candidatus Rifleibacteriota bacterium]